MNRPRVSIFSVRRAWAGALMIAGALCAGTLAAGSADPVAWHAPPPPEPAVVVVRGATIWTSGPDGQLENADLVVRDGRIVAVGADVAADAPADALTIDGRGKHVTAGIIDPHSHISTAGGVNEATNIVTAEVRIEDVIDAHDIAIYRQLAGGTTVAHIMHGSANSIGGQTAVIKMRWGQDARGLHFKAANPGIKFALGENPKQSNWGVSQLRYPQTRAGVEGSIRDALAAAEDLRRTREQHAAAGRDAIPPRPDLQVDALLEVLDGTRDVHSHSYRADEILMLLDVAADHGFVVKVFQHGLDAYKVADELAAAGSGVSSFSDWWAYKFEVIDAIPHNGAILHERGVLTSFNSDDDELGRRLNLEAAKAVRYGGVAPREALKFMTLNPAIQLGIDDRVGSLEPGKDADFVVWSGDPLSTYSICEWTFIDGRPYFSRARDLENRAAIAEERAQLLAAVRAASGSGGDDAADGDEAETSEAPEAPEASDTQDASYAAEVLP
ncbi:MAG: amidohydrolase family protein [Acidobacteriota bacterium]